MTSIANRITALTSSLTRDRVAAMSPVDRQHLADQCQRVFRMTEIARADAANTPRSGVLQELATLGRYEG